VLALHFDAIMPKSPPLASASASKAPTSAAKAIVLNGICFKSKAAAKQVIRDYINERLDAKEAAPVILKNDVMFALLVDVVHMSPRRGWLMKGGVEKFLILPDKSLSVKSAGNASDVNFSYSGLIDNPDKTVIAQQKLTMAMRTTIQPQIDAFREKEFISGVTTCRYHNCDNPTVPLTKCHIDHYEITFAELKNRFLDNIRKTELPTAHQFTIDRNETSTSFRRTKFRESHLPLETRWFKYHAEYARLRVVCERCNLSNIKIDARNGHNQTKLTPYVNKAPTTSTTATNAGFAAPRTIQQMFATKDSK
jgi:hypothetical protein